MKALDYEDERVSSSDVATRLDEHKPIFIENINIETTCTQRRMINACWCVDRVISCQIVVVALHATTF